MINAQDIKNGTCIRMVMVWVIRTVNSSFYVLHFIAIPSNVYSLRSTRVGVWIWD